MKIGIGMRWWLTAVFALIAAVTALATGLLVSGSSDREFRQRAQQLAAGSAFESAIAVRHAAASSDLRQRRGAARFSRAIQTIAAKRKIALFVFDQQGALLTPARSHGVALDSIEERDEALASALGGRRFVATDTTVKATVVGIPLTSRDPAALVIYASHPDLSAGLGIVHREIVRAALWAILVGALIGIVIATLIASRLRRIGAAASAIEEGHFGVAVHSRFHDELGDLSQTIDRMRRRLQHSFAQVSRERDRLQSLLSRLQEGVVTVDRALHVEFANHEARRLLNAALRPGDPLPREPLPRFYLRELARNLFITHEPFETQVEADESSTYSVAGIPAPGASETVIIVVTDISERQRRERAEREFVANAAHELRTPLTTITGAIEALQSGAKEDARLRDRFLAHIERESGRLRRLVRALLVLARAQTGEEMPALRPVELEPLLEDAARELVPHEGVRVQVSCPPGLTAAADPDLLAQALSNLAANAAAHTDHGRIRLSAAARDGFVLIEVSDTGTGIRPEHQRPLFDRFYRGPDRNVEGFGLGLSIVREVVKALGGDVELDSELGRGTTVSIRLSTASARAA
jgi:two-component system sensor histidine kinase VicK